MSEVCENTTCNSTRCIHCTITQQCVVKEQLYIRLFAFEYIYIKTKLLLIYQMSFAQTKVKFFAQCISIPQHYLLILNVFIMTKPLAKQLRKCSAMHTKMPICNQDSHSSHLLYLGT